MAVKSNKQNPKSKKTEPEKNPEPAGGLKAGENEKEPAEDPETGDGPLLEKPKVLTATRPILYLAKMYQAGDKLPTNNQEMVAAWIEAGSAAWQEPGAKQFP